MNEKILVVEDQFLAANNLQAVLQQAGYQVCPIARSVPVAIKIIEQENPDMVLLDTQFKGVLTGIELANYLNQKNIAFVYLSANSNRQTMDAARQTKPYGFLLKPIRERDLLATLDIACYLHRQNREFPQTKTIAVPAAKTGGKEESFDEIIGISPGMREVIGNIRAVSKTDTTVLLLGESGTGKEVVANAMHRCSLRKDRPFIVVNCGALPSNLIESELFGHEKGAFTSAFSKKEGKFVQAEGGTIFLDEIGELPLESQVKLLRVLQELQIEPIGGRARKVDVRIIAATNRDLEAEMAAGRFRLDLYYRLNVFPIIIPPLRYRKADIRVLADHFLQKFSARQGKQMSGFSVEVLKTMEEYGWPGNVRELEHVLERAVLLSPTPIINTLSLPKRHLSTTPAVLCQNISTMEENERSHIITALEKCRWKIHGSGGAAEVLDLNASTLSSRMKKLGISKRQV